MRRGVFLSERVSPIIGGMPLVDFDALDIQIAETQARAEKLQMEIQEVEARLRALTAIRNNVLLLEGRPPITQERTLPVSMESTQVVFEQLAQYSRSLTHGRFDDDNSAHVLESPAPKRTKTPSTERVADIVVGSQKHWTRDEIGRAHV